MSTTVELDKHFTTDAGETHGTISIRVVVLKPKAKDDKDEDDDAPPVSADADFDDDVGTSKSKSPLASYLEKQAHGKWCVVFLVMGQRHHAWDNTFISRDLGFKYLRDRTMIVVDLDGLAMHALAEIIQGSRQGLFEGKVYFAIRDRIVQTLKSDPQLKKLELEAQQKVLEMEAGDEAVKSKLDQLIEGHHAKAKADGPGGGDATGVTASEAPRFSDGMNPQPIIVMGRDSLGEEAELPVLVTEPRIAAMRLHPGEPKTVVVTSHPRNEWANLSDLRVQLAAPIDGLTVTESRGGNGSTLTVSFDDADDYDDEDYPVQGEIQVYARFTGHTETRALCLPVVVTKKRGPRTTVPIELLDEPTKLKVKSRQPIRLMPGGPVVHVKLEWNGKESLIRGTNPRWKFNARCVTLGTFPRIGFASMADGRLELVLYPPHGMLTNNHLEFEAVATGPDDKRLQATFRAIVIDPPAPAPTGPRRVTSAAPQTAGQRRPPYELKYIYEKDWTNPDCPRWDGNDWTAQDAGRFIDQTDTTPLILVLNQDMELLKSFRDDMVKRKLVEATVKERVNRYVSHVAFHLYQMYGQFKKKTEQKQIDETVRPPTENELQDEVNRVGTTIMKLMDVASK